MAWTLILCEGRHERAALSHPLVFRGWRLEAPRKVRQRLPRALGNLGGSEETAFLEHEATGSMLALHACGGVDRLFGGTTRDLLRNLDLTQLAGFGVLVDADDHGVAERTRQLASSLLPLLQDPPQPWVGDRMESAPRVGLWVAPDNLRKGTLDDLLIEALSGARETLLKSARAFVHQTPDFHEPGFRPRDQSKAVLGAAAQALAPGRSLEVALGSPEHAPQWFTAAACGSPGLVALLDWVERLAGVR